MSPEQVCFTLEAIKKRELDRRTVRIWLTSGDFMEGRSAGIDKLTLEFLQDNGQVAFVDPRNIIAIEVLSYPQEKGGKNAQ